VGGARPRRRTGHGVLVRRRVERRAGGEGSGGGWGAVLDTRGWAGEGLKGGRAPGRIGAGVVKHKIRTAARPGLPLCTVRAEAITRRRAEPRMGGARAASALLSGPTRSAKGGKTMKRMKGSANVAEDDRQGSTHCCSVPSLFPLSLSLSPPLSRVAPPCNERPARRRVVGLTVAWYGHFTGLHGVVWSSPLSDKKPACLAPSN